MLKMKEQPNQQTKDGYYIQTCRALCNKGNQSMLTQISDILAELQAQDKKITLCNVPAYMTN